MSAFNAQALEPRGSAWLTGVSPAPTYGCQRSARDRGAACRAHPWRTGAVGRVRMICGAVS
jgi:hypothetical protein